MTSTSGLTRSPSDNAASPKRTEKSSTCRISPRAKAAPRSGATNPRTMPAAIPIRTWTYRLFSRRMPSPSSGPEKAERRDAQADDRADEREPPEEQRAGQQRDRAEHDRDLEADLRDV